MMGCSIAEARQRLTMSELLSWADYWAESPPLPIMLNHAQAAIRATILAAAGVSAKPADLLMRFKRQQEQTEDALKALLDSTNPESKKHG